MVGDEVVAGWIAADLQLPQELLKCGRDEDVGGLAILGNVPRHEDGLVLNVSDLQLSQLTGADEAVIDVLSHDLKLLGIVFEELCFDGWGEMDIGGLVDLEGAQLSGG